VREADVVQGTRLTVQVAGLGVQGQRLLELGGRLRLPALVPVDQAQVDQRVRLTSPVAGRAGRAAGVADHWWVEHDEATESLPTVRRKIETYLDFWQRGGQGPQDVVPRVLISAITEQRAKALEGMMRRLPALARDLVKVTTSARAAVQIYEVLRE
jgi:hypothetical protein